MALFYLAFTELPTSLKFGYIKVYDLGLSNIAYIVSYLHCTTHPFGFGFGFEWQLFPVTLLLTFNSFSL